MGQGEGHACVDVQNECAMDVVGQGVVDAVTATHGGNGLQDGGWWSLLLREEEWCCCEEQVCSCMHGRGRRLALQQQ